MEGRPGKKQFEVFSADFSFNKAYMKDYELCVDAAEINDHIMLEDVISMVFYPNQTCRKKKVTDTVGGWEYVKSLVASTNSKA